MSYIELIKNYWVQHNAYQLSVTDAALYLYLLEVNNVCRWSKTFNRNNSKILADLNISFKTLSNARNRLKEVGMIDFKTQNGCSNVSYTFGNFQEVSAEVYAEVATEVCAEVCAEVVDVVGAEVENNNPTFVKFPKVSAEVGAEINKTKDKDNTKKEKNKKEKNLTLPFYSEKFIEAWNNLLQMPKWRKKIDHSLQLALNKLSEFDEAFAIELIEQAITGDWQGIVYSDTKEKYAKWKQHGKTIESTSKQDRDNEFAMHIAAKMGGRAT